MCIRDRSVGGCWSVHWLGWLQYIKFCWVGKHVNSSMKPTNSLTQGQPNPRKNRLKVAFGPRFFPQQIVFRGLGLVLCGKQTTRKPNPTRFSANALYWLVAWLVWLVDWWVDDWLMDWSMRVFAIYHISWFLITLRLPVVLHYKLP